jgi:hypothetical protein
MKPTIKYTLKNASKLIFCVQIHMTKNIIIIASKLNNLELLNPPYTINMNGCVQIAYTTNINNNLFTYTTSLLIKILFTIVENREDENVKDAIIETFNTDWNKNFIKREVEKNKNDLKNQYIRFYNDAIKECVFLDINKIVKEVNCFENEI